MRLILPYNSYSHRAKQVASRRLMNCFVEAVPVPGKAPIALLRSPGIDPWTELNAGPIRGSIVHSGLLYVVSGQVLYSIASNAALNVIGAIPGIDHVRMATNGTQLVIVSEPDGFIYEGSTLVQITDPDFTVRGASDVACIDSFMIYIEPDSGRAFSSEFLDAGNVDPLEFATAEGAPDNLVAVLVDHRQIFLFGVDTTELWFNSGATGFPFLREQNGFIEVGCGARRSPAKADNTVVWFDDKRIARKLVDITPQRISTHAVEQAWQDYETVDDAFSVTYIHEGHTFWCLNFPTEGASWEYDFATNEWHDRSSRIASGAPGMWRVATCVWCYGENIVGDARSGKLGHIDANTFTEWGELQRMEFTFPSVYSEGRRAFHKRLQIEFEAGVGLNLGQGNDPQVMLDVSDDGGKSFTPITSRSLGKIGNYRWRSVWNRLGTSDDRVYRAAITDPVRVAVIDAQLDVEGGRL